jgi:alanyl-tRNA synthetase
MDALRHLAKERAIVAELSDLVKAQPADLTDRIAAMVARLRDAEREITQLRQAQALASAGSLVDATIDVNGARFLGHDAGESNADDLRALVLDLRQRLGESAPSVVAVAGQSKGRPLVVIGTNAAARQRGVKAGELVRTAAQTLGGGGGGKDDLAQGGGQDVSRIEDALSAVRWRLGELTG